MSKMVIEMDSSQLSEFATCESLWNYGYRQSLIPLSTDEASENDAMLMGTYMHAMADTYYKERAIHHNNRNAMEAALATNMDAQTCLCGHHVTTHIESVGKCLEVDCSCALMTYAPFPLGKDKMSEVRERFILYCYTFAARDFVIDDPKQVEVGFAECLEETDEHIFLLTGRMDLFKPKVDGTTFGFADHKLQVRRRDLYKKRIQFRTYGMVARESMAMINYFRMAKTVDKDTFKREIITYEPGEHNWWRGQLLIYFNRVKAARIANTYKHEWDACEGKYGYPCKFARICNAPKLELVTIQMHYKQKQEWRPW